MSEPFVPRQACEVCSNTVDAAVFDPGIPGQEKDPLLYLFIGSSLCKGCQNTLLKLHPLPIDHNRNRPDTPAQFIFGIRRIVAHALLFVPQDERKIRILCELCFENEAVRPHPGTPKIANYADFPPYKGLFYCEACYGELEKSRGRWSEFFFQSKGDRREQH